MNIRDQTLVGCIIVKICAAALSWASPCKSVRLLAPSTLHVVI